MISIPMVYQKKMWVIAPLATWTVFIPLVLVYQNTGRFDFNFFTHFKFLPVIL